MPKQALTEQEKEDRQKHKEIKKQTNEKIFDILFVEDELSWQQVIYSLVETEDMNPWDIDVSVIAKKFIEMLAKLKELDFRISGKMVLASAILLKMKSDRLIEEDLIKFDNMMNPPEENLPLDADGKPIYDMSGKPQIYPRTPQPRKRKVSVFDLVKALEKALQVESKRFKYVKHEKIEMPVLKNEFDLTKSMFKIYEDIKKHYDGKKTKDRILTYEDLLPNNSKREKILTIIPLLHLDTQRKIDLDQAKEFETILIKLAEKIDIAKLEEEFLKQQKEEAELEKENQKEEFEKKKEEQKEESKKDKEEPAEQNKETVQEEKIEQKIKLSSKKKPKKQH